MVPSLSPAGDGYQGGAKIARRHFFFGFEEYSHCLFLGSDRNDINLKIDLLSVLVEVTFIWIPLGFWTSRLIKTMAQVN